MAIKTCAPKIHSLNSGNVAKDVIICPGSKIYRIPSFLNNFDNKKKFSSWIYRIVHNQAINIAKKYQKETPLLEDWDFEGNDDLEKDFEQKEIVENVEKCLSEIPLLYSEPMTLYYIEEKSYEEISDILKIPMGTVATRISRAKKIMKNICQKN